MYYSQQYIVLYMYIPNTNCIEYSKYFGFQNINETMNTTLQDINFLFVYVNHVLIMFLGWFSV